MAEKIFDKVKPGVVTGKDVQEIFRIAKANQFALPAVNVTGTDTVNAVLEAAKAVKSPVIIQFSNGGGEGQAHSNVAPPHGLSGAFLPRNSE